MQNIIFVEEEEHGSQGSESDFEDHHAVITAGEDDEVRVPNSETLVAKKKIKKRRTQDGSSQVRSLVHQDATSGDSQVCNPGSQTDSRKTENKFESSDSEESDYCPVSDDSGEDSDNPGQYTGQFLLTARLGWNHRHPDPASHPCI